MLFGHLLILSESLPLSMKNNSSIHFKPKKVSNLKNVEMMLHLIWERFESNLHHWAICQSQVPPHPLRFTFQFLSLTYFHLLIFFFCALLYKTEIFSKMNISFIRDAREASPPSAGGQKLTARLPPLLPITAEAMWLSLCWPHLLRHSSLLFTILLTRSTSYHCERDRAVQFPFKITSVTLQLKDKQRKHFQTAF